MSKGTSFAWLCICFIFMICVLPLHAEQTLYKSPVGNILLGKEQEYFRYEAQQGQVKEFSTETFEGPFRQKSNILSGASLHEYTQAIHLSSLNTFALTNNELKFKNVDRMNIRIKASYNDDSCPDPLFDPQGRVFLLTHYDLNALLTSNWSDLDDEASTTYKWRRLFSDYLLHSDQKKLLENYSTSFLNASRGNRTDEEHNNIDDIPDI